MGPWVQEAANKESWMDPNLPAPLSSDDLSRELVIGTPVPMLLEVNEEILGCSPCCLLKQPVVGSVAEAVGNSFDGKEDKRGCDIVLSLQCLLRQP